MPTRERMSAIGLALLALYCFIALFFTGGGHDVGGGFALLGWAGAIGGSLAAWFLFQRKPIGRRIGIAVFLLGAIYYVCAALVSTLRFGDRAFLVVIAAINALGVFALSGSNSRS